MKPTPPDKAANTSHLDFCSNLFKFTSILNPCTILDMKVSGLIESTDQITAYSRLNTTATFHLTQHNLLSLGLQCLLGYSLFPFCQASRNDGSSCLLLFISAKR